MGAATSSDRTGGTQPPALFASALASGVARTPLSGTGSSQSGSGSSRAARRRVAAQLEAEFTAFSWRHFCATLFKKYDKSRTGALNRSEMFDVFCDVTGAGEEERGSEAALRFVAAMDQDNDKAVSRSEFQRCCREIIRVAARGGAGGAATALAATPAAAAAPITATQAFVLAMRRSGHPLLQASALAEPAATALDSAAPPALRRSTSHKARSVLVEVDDMRLTLLRIDEEAQRMVFKIGVAEVEFVLEWPVKYRLGKPNQLSLRLHEEGLSTLFGDARAKELLDVLRALGADVAAHSDVNAKRHMGFVLSTLALRFDSLRRSEAVGRFLTETMHRPIRELCGLCGLLPHGASAELMARADVLRTLLSHEVQRLLTQPQPGFEVVPAERDPFVWNVRLHGFDRATTTGRTLQQWAEAMPATAAPRSEEMWLKVEFPLDYPSVPPVFFFQGPLLETGTGFVDNGVVALSELRPDVWRSSKADARTGTARGCVGELIHKFRSSFAQGRSAAKVAIDLDGEYDRAGFDATWRLLRSGLPPRQFSATRLDSGSKDEYGRKIPRSGLSESDLTMRVMKMSDALNFAEQSGIKGELVRHQFSNLIFFPDSKGRERQNLFDDSPYASSSSATRVTLEIEPVQRVNRGARFHCTLAFGTHSLSFRTPHAIVADHVYDALAARSAGGGQEGTTTTTTLEEHPVVRMRPVCLPAVSVVTLRPRRNVEGSVTSTEGWLRQAFLQRIQCLTLGTTICVGVRTAGEYLTEVFTVVEVVSKEKDERWGALQIAPGEGPLECTAVSVADRFLVEVGVKLQPESGLEKLGSTGAAAASASSADAASAGGGGALSPRRSAVLAATAERPAEQRVCVPSFRRGRAPTVAVHIALWRGFVAEGDGAPSVVIQCHPDTDLAEVHQALADALDLRPARSDHYLGNLLHAGEDPRDVLATTPLPLVIESIAVQGGGTESRPLITPGAARPSGCELPIAGELQRSLTAAMSIRGTSPRKKKHGAARLIRTVRVRQSVPSARRCSITGAANPALTHVVGPGIGDCRTLMGLSDASACPWIGEMTSARELTEYERRICSWVFVKAHNRAGLL